MARTPKTFVAEIGPELALPLARSYCMFWNLAHDPESGRDMLWMGAFIANSLRAAVGLASLGNQGMLVSGVFTDGSEYALTGAKMLVERLTEVPVDLWGTLHLPTQQARRLFRRSGWALTQGVV